jgi:succinate dehydrogenase / fumarate reductase cytochrome b subunit
MVQFWGQMHFGEIPTKTYGDNEVKDLFTVVGSAFQEWWYVALYCISMVAIAFHLWHGFESAFQTLGLNHMKYNPVISFVGKAFSIVVPALFAIIPILMFFV